MKIGAHPYFRKPPYVNHTLPLPIPIFRGFTILTHRKGFLSIGKIFQKPPEDCIFGSYSFFVGDAGLQPDFFYGLFQSDYGLHPQDVLTLDRTDS